MILSEEDSILFPSARKPWEEVCLQKETDKVKELTKMPKMLLLVPIKFVPLAASLKVKKKIEKSKLKVTAWQMCSARKSQCLWFESTTKVWTNIWDRLHVMQIKIHMHSPSLAHRITKETARVSWIFVQGTSQVTRKKNIRKHLQSKLVAGIAPNSEDHKQQT